jgi:hypothetical protein
MKKLYYNDDEALAYIIIAGYFAIISVIAAVAAY